MIVSQKIRFLDDEVDQISKYYKIGSFLKYTNRSMKLSVIEKKLVKNNLRFKENIY